MKAGIVIGAVIVAALVIGVAAYGLGLFGGSDDENANIPAGIYVAALPGTRTTATNSNLENRAIAILDSNVSVLEADGHSLVVNADGTVTIRLGTGTEAFLNTGSVFEENDWKIVKNGGGIEFKYRSKTASPSAPWNHYNGSSLANRTHDGNPFVYTLYGNYNETTGIINLVCTIKLGGDSVSLTLDFRMLA